MDIFKYTAFFHDGAITDIKHDENGIEFFMKSAEMDIEDIVDDKIILTKDNRIKGILHIEGIKNIKIDDNHFFGLIEKKYDRGKIFDFEMKKNSVELSIDWVNFPPKLQINEFTNIKIEADKIYWVKIPNLSDDE